MSVWKAPGFRILVAATFVVLAVAAAVGTIALAQPLPPPMTKRDTAKSSVANAVCNDGSTPVFYHRGGSGPDANKWIVYLQGGGGCTSEGSCQRRAADQAALTTAARTSPTVNPSGILSPLQSVNPDFARYNHVFVHYCSSDFWAGATDRRIGDRVWHFQGRAIVNAVIDTLLTQSFEGAPTLATASEVLVAGSSAGAIGTHNNVDHIAARLPAAKTKGVLDSGWIPNITPFGPGIFDVMPYGSEAYAFYNAQVDASCAAANPRNPGLCLNQEVAFPHLTTPTFVYADQRDPTILSALGIVGAPANSAERAYVMRFSRAVRDGVSKTPAHFAAARNRHTILLDREFGAVASGGVKFMETLGNWYFDRSSKKQIVATPGR